MTETNSNKDAIIEYWNIQKIKEELFQTKRTQYLIKHSPDYPGRGKREYE